MYKFTDSEIISFTTGLIKIKDELAKPGLDMILAPMMGAVPLVDGINVVDPNFDNSNIFYVPASSSLYGVEQIITKTVANILKDKVELSTILNKPYAVKSIDEVVGGGSAVRVRRDVNKGIRSFADKSASDLIKKAKQGDSVCRDRFGLDVNSSTPAKEIPFLHRQISDMIYSKFDYKSIGLEHGAFRKSGKPRQATYVQLVNDGKIIPVEVERIITMDNPDLCPVRYMPRNDIPYKNYPTIQPDIVVNEQYLDLLAVIAARAGSNADASPKNLMRIKEHNRKYVPKEHHAPEQTLQTQVTLN